MQIEKRTPIIHMYNKDWTICSNVVSHFRFNIQHNFGEKDRYALNMTCC